MGGGNGIKKLIKKIKQEAGYRPSPLAIIEKAPDDIASFRDRAAERLRELRMDSGMSADKIVSRINQAGYEITRSAWFHYERGRRPIPIELIPYIANAVGVSVRGVLPYR